MALVDVLGKDDIREIRNHLEDLLQSYEFRLELDVPPIGTFTARLVMRPRTKEEKTQIREGAVLAR